ncbi:MAG: alanine--tRNA ligase [Proteobacteria bacterium]|nr:alanine--tRNA ligase [Pseudomonadota bacterium]
MKVAELRNSFLIFFEKKDHTIVSSSSLVPNDETLLFTNAGMVQFKDVFLDREQRAYTRAATVQRCVRAGGKHNDLENVGYTIRHHTFFEMLGNFSFGDYFKREAIQMAWEYLTQVLKLPEDKLYITVFKEDKEAKDIWLNEIKISPTRFKQCSEKDNFWSMGDTGPCGPCTEIYYDHGVEADPNQREPDEEGDRFIEIWNLVFMQYNRTSDGKLLPLPRPSVDTGMGMERLAAVMQGVRSNYDIDLFVNLIKAAASILKLEDLAQKSLRVLADHIRSTAFLIADGVVPSNEGRGYVLRRIMRRALRHGNQLGANEPFFFQLVKPLVIEMGEAYPTLKSQQSYIEKIILKEEEQFARTLDQGLKILEQEIKQLPGRIHGNILGGEILFKLYDTYGFPVDLTADIARERGLQVDIAGFEREMESQRDRARAASQFGVDYNKNANIGIKTEFTGYESLEETAEVVALFKGDQQVLNFAAGDKGYLILKHTPFYAESGGQVGDKGILINNKNIFRVDDTQKMGEAIIHVGEMIEGQIQVKDRLTAKVDAQKRQATKLNHSATHLLHAALREIIGKHVTQKGSLVAPDRLRFDFTHFEPLNREQIQQLEDCVNDKILENTEATITETTPEEAIKQGAMALFGEKYGKTVRVLNMGHGFSVELCGGTHTARTGDIGLFKIISESGIAAGVRRIEALTGKGALKWLSSADNTVTHLSQLLKGDRETVESKVIHLQERIRDLEKETQRLKSKLASGAGSDLTTEAIEIKGIKLLVKKLVDADPKMMRDLVDDLKNKLHTAVVVLAVVNEGKAQIVVGITKNCIDKITAGELANFVAIQLGGKGGGRPDLAQAGGTNIDALDKALASIADWVNKRL